MDAVIGVHDFECGLVVDGDVPNDSLVGAFFIKDFSNLFGGFASELERMFNSVFHDDLVPFCVSVLLVYHMCLRVCQDRNTMNYTTPMLYFPTYALARALIVCSRSCSLNQSSGTIF